MEWVGRSMGADSQEVSSQAQRATFVIFSNLISVDQMTSIIGYAADCSLAKGEVGNGAITCIPAKGSSWEIREEDDSITEAITRLFRRLWPIQDKLRELRDLGCLMQISIVQYITPESDLGFAIDAENVKLLADVGSLIDIDQYVES